MRSWLSRFISLTSLVVLTMRARKTRVGVTRVAGSQSPKGTGEREIQVRVTQNEDKIDTAPVFMTDKTGVVFESLDLEINEKNEIVLAPDKPMRCPTLFMRCCSSEVVVEKIYHGRAAITRQEHWPVELFKMGHRFDVTVTKEEPIKIVIVNLGPEKSNVGASLVSNPPDDEDSRRKIKETP